MAISESIALALVRLGDALMKAELIGDSLRAVACTPPAWVDMYVLQVESIREQAESLEVLLRGEVLPLLARGSL
jgi:hypothetical protein